MRGDSESSSSDFSSDEEDNALEASLSSDPSLAPRVVAVESLEDDLEAESSPAAGVALVASLRSDAAVPAELVAALEPVLTVQAYAYEAYTTALYYLSSLWPQDVPAATQRALLQVRAELYRRFHVAFPLTPDMYSEYIASVESTATKLRLYEQAQRDYWSVALVVEHLQLLAEYQHELEHVTWSTVEAAIEHALATVGCHYTQGHDAWKTARELAMEHLDSDDEAKEAAVRALFVRQMRLPLQQNDLVMSEFRAWNEYNALGDAAERARAMNDAVQRQQKVFGGVLYKKLNQFEARLDAALAGTVFGSSEQVEIPERVWTQYVRFAQSKLAPLMASPEDADRYVVCLMERAVASVCLSSSLWNQYVQYVTAQQPDHVEQVAQRATRNVSFDSSFWVEWLLAMETSGATADKISLSFETTLLKRTSPPLMDAAHMARTLTTFCGVVRRRSDDSQTAVDAVVAQCRRSLEAAFSEDKTPVAALLLFQAQFYAFKICAGDMTLLITWREIWNEILQVRGGHAEAWIGFYEEYRFVHATSPTLVQKLRDEVFKPAVDQVVDYPLSILERWVAFEQTVGDHVNCTNARDKYQVLAQKYQHQSLAEPAAVAAALPTTVAPEKPASKKRKVETSQPAPAKRQKVPEPAAEIKKTERFTNDNTVFVCNMSKDATKEELQALFAHIPTLQDVRLVVKERGSHMKSRGMAYVQFSDEAGVVAGLVLDGALLHGQQIKVERSIPPSGKAASNSKAQGNKGGKATTTVYVGGLLPPEREPITEEQVQVALTELLGEGTVKQVLILTDKRGRPKDYGLVQVTDKKHVDAAIKKQTELRLKFGDQITVQTSRMTIEQVVRHRDEQKQATQKAKETTPKLPHKEKKEEFQAKVAPHSKPNTRLATPAKPRVASAAGLMPRALRKKTIASTTNPTTLSSANAATPKPTSASSETPAATPKTNADFRKLFLS